MFYTTRLNPLTSSQYISMKENPAPTSPPPIQSVSSQIPLTGVSPQVIPLIALSTYPAIIDCPNCHARTTTRVNLTTGARATYITPYVFPFGSMYV